MKFALVTACIALAATSIGSLEARAAESKMAKKFMAGPAIQGNSMGKLKKKKPKTSMHKAM